MLDPFIIVAPSCDDYMWFGEFFQSTAYVLYVTLVIVVMIAEIHAFHIGKAFGYVHFHLFWTSYAGSQKYVALLHVLETAHLVC